MQKLTISIEKNSELNNIYIAHFGGAFDGSAEGSLAELNDMLQKGADNLCVILDFSALNFLNSYAIGQLVAWRQSVEEKKGKLIITGMNKNVEEILGLVGVSNLFQIFPDVSKAIASLK